jgi:serine/threonine-protein kinase
VSAPESLIGVTIAGKYAVRRTLGAGGMGAVYEGEHLEIGKRVAIKVIDARHAAYDEMAARFRREARAASAVESEHIVQVFDVGQDPNAGLYMVMELLTGEDLAHRLARLGGRLPLEDALAVGVQTARALAKAHGAGVVHRDLKPANLFLVDREDGSIHVKILDFGISKLLREEPSEASPAATGKKALTREGAVIGTPQYMSPEQAQGQNVDARTDVWSLGALLYEALAGAPAYEEKPSYEMTIIQIVTTSPKPLREIAPSVPEAVADVVNRALIHDREKRLPDCATFARELGAGRSRPSSPELAPTVSADRPEALATSMPANAPLAPTVGGVSVTNGDTAHAKSRTRIAILGAAVLVLIAGGAALALGFGGGKTTAVVETPSAQPAAPAASPAAAPAPPASITALSAPPLDPPPVASDKLEKPAPPPMTKKASPSKTTTKTPPGDGKQQNSKQAPQYGGAGVTTNY